MWLWPVESGSVEGGVGVGCLRDVLLDRPASRIMKYNFIIGLWLFCNLMTSSLLENVILYSLG